MKHDLTTAMGRYLARKSGLDVPMRKPGPAKGSQCGKNNKNWKGDSVGWDAAHDRAQAALPNIGPCSKCGAEKSERHHKDGNPWNNALRNLEVLCRKCHMEADGRLEQAKRRLDQYRGAAVQARIAAVKKRIMAQEEMQS